MIVAKLPNNTKALFKLKRKLKSSELHPVKSSELHLSAATHAPGLVDTYNFFGKPVELLITPSTYGHDILSAFKV